VRLWDAATGLVGAPLTGTSMALSPDGKRFVTRRAGGSVRLGRRTTGAAV